MGNGKDKGIDSDQSEKVTAAGSPKEAPKDVPEKAVSTDKDSASEPSVAEETQGKGSRAANSRAADSRAAGSPTEKPPAKEKSGSGAGSALAIFLALVAIGFAAWPAYKLYEIDQQTAVVPVDTSDDRITQLAATQRNTHLTLESLQQELTALSNDRDALLASQAGLAQQMTESLESIRSRADSSPQDWVYAEVEYLIRMANQRALMEADVSAALSLLQSADRIMRDTEGLTSHGLRRALATDIAALKAVNAADVQGIYLELSALVKQVPRLTRELPVFLPTDFDATTAEAAAGVLPRIRAALARIGARLASLVDFRRGAAEITPILPPKEEYYLRQNLLLKLQIAQMALLDGDQAVYGSAMEQAQQWLLQGFDPDDAATIAMHESLERLSQERIAIDIPDISASLEAARAHVRGLNGEAVR